MSAKPRKAPTVGPWVQAQVDHALLSPVGRREGPGRPNPGWLKRAVGRQMTVLGILLVIGFAGGFVWHEIWWLSGSTPTCTVESAERRTHAHKGGGHVTWSVETAECGTVELTSGDWGSPTSGPMLSVNP
jgi:hypothetical protein